MNHLLKTLPPISRDGRGKLYTLPPKQRRKAKQLIRSECCNYDAAYGECFLLDDGCGCVCPQIISSQILCRWFNHAVLPMDSSLYAELIRDPSRRKWEICEAALIPGANSAKYCPECRKRVHRKQKTESERKRRSVVDIQEDKNAGKSRA